MDSKILKLGTRKSLLAIAQSSWVARELEKLNPGIKIELEGIETRGDIILDKPLSQIEGKEFFTAELDHALLRGEVDLTVHSMKDLSLDRPASFVLAGVPARELQHDVILFHESVIERLKRGEPIRIGTSSPRRLTLIPGFLKNALPRFDLNLEPNIQFVEIRGNVNTRLSRVHEANSSDRKLDGVVLAFAGLERLAMDATASVELTRLLENTRLMVLPLKLCPSAPAQGALAIEARTEDLATREIISKLHHEPTLQAVKAEREVLSEWGGGCHQKLGASLLPNGALYIRGQKQNGDSVEEIRGGVQAVASSFVKIDASDVFDFKPRIMTQAEQLTLEQSTFVFVAHSRAVEFLGSPTVIHTNSKKRIWVSGSQSWFKLALKGIWVEGSLEGQGFEWMNSLIHKKLLRIPRGPITSLTHAESAESLGALNLGTYQHEFREVPEKFHTHTSLYWSSGLSFQALWSKLGAEVLIKKNHACGLGKTAKLIQDHLKPFDLKPTLFSME